MSRFVMTHIPFVIACGALAGLVLLAAPPAPAQESDKLLAEVKAAWEKRQNAINSLKVTWKSKTFVPKGSLSATMPRRPDQAQGDAPPQDTTHEGTGELLLEGKKARVVIRDSIWDGSLDKFLSTRTESAFDGKRFTRLLVPETQWPMATIHNADHNADGDLLSNAPIFFCARGLDRTLARTGYLPAYTEVRKTTVDGRQTIELVRPRDETRGEFRMQVDPAQGMSLRRVEVYDREGRLSFRVSITQAAIGPPEVGWLPGRWTAQAYQINKQLLNKTDIELSSIAINPVTNDADFQIAFPPNTRVTDRSDTKADYIAREDGTRRDILPEEMHAEHENLVKTNTGDLAPGTKNSHANSWLWISGGVVLGVLSLGMAFRQFRKK